MADVAALRAKYRRFEWPVALGTGIGAYCAGYLALVGYTLVGVASIPGPIRARLVRLGWIHYNAHTVYIVADAPPNVVTPPVSLVDTATEPLVYYAVPVLALLVAAGLFTRWRDPTEPDGGLAIATGVGMTIGYLLCMLVGSYLFVRTEASATFHPDRLSALTYGLLYPLVLGTVGSLGTQLYLTD
jgi:hypothetical protein